MAEPTVETGVVTGTTKIPRLHLPDGTVQNIRLVAWSNGMLTWESVDE